MIDRAIDTLKHALTEEIILVTLATSISLALPQHPHRHAAAANLPFSRLFRDEGKWMTSNIMSLSGIAIAIGVLVDAAIVLTENVLRHCEEAERANGGKRLSAQETMQLTLEASKQVGRPIFFAMVIIILAFVPVFALTGQEGKLFHPLAFTKTFAMAAPPCWPSRWFRCSAVCWSGDLSTPSTTTGSCASFPASNRPTLDWALHHRKSVIGMAALILAAALLLAFGLPANLRDRLHKGGFHQLAAMEGMGSEFMPPLNEGSLLFMPVLLPSTSLTEVRKIMNWQDRVIRELPEVASVAGKLGRAETATDPAPVEMIETTIMLKPETEWRPGMTRDKLVEELTSRLSVLPGYVPGFLQPIENRILMISTGIRAQLGIKVLGDNLDALQATALQAEAIVRQINGAIGVTASRIQGKPYLEIEADRDALSRHGLTAREVLDVVETGIGGMNVTTLIDGRRRVPLQVRLGRAERDDIEQLARIPVQTREGASLPLGELAHIRRTTGPSEINSENGRLRMFVQSNVQGRDLAGFVEEVKARLGKELKLGPGMTLEYSGNYEHQIRARKTLMIIVPAAMFIIFLLLYMVYHNAKEAAHVILAVPFALSGGVFLQWALGVNFSVAAWVGYIALFGTAIQTGVVMVVYLEEAINRKRTERGGALTADDLLEAIKEGARLRLRPKVMTVATIVASLLPILWSHRTGAEVMRPLAIPVIGGMLSSLLHILIVTPVIVAWAENPGVAFTKWNI